MPQIKEYTFRTEVAAPQRQRLASGEGFGIGRQVGELGQAVSNFGEALYKRQEQSELSDANVAVANAHKDFTLQLDDQLQKGNIDTEDLSQKFDDYVSKTGEQFSTRGASQYFNQASASLKAHFLQSAAAGQSELAAVKAKENYQSAINGFSSGLMSDPSALDTVSKAHDGYLDSLVETGGLPAKTAIQLKEQGKTELAKAAVRGWTQLNPQDAKAQLESGKWDESIGGDLKKQLVGEADMHIRANEVEQERLRKDQERIVKVQQQETQNDFLEKMVEGSLSTKDVLNSNLEAFGSGSKKQFLQMMNTTNSVATKSDSATFNSIYQRIHLDDGDPNKISDENVLNSYLGKGLSLKGIRDLRKEMQGIGTEAGAEERAMKKNVFNQAKSQLTKANPILGIKDPVGEENLARFYTFFSEEYAKQKQSGKTAKQLLDPDSPDYLGKYVRNFVKTPQEVMRESIRMTQPQEPIPLPGAQVKARQPGETIDAWVKRTKGP